MKPIIKSILLGAALTTLLPLAQAQFIITEIAALGTGLADEDGETSDWIEIRNLGISEADLAGWTLTDSAGQLDTWTFPPTSVPALGYIVVFASGKDRAITGSELHANFSLASGGEYLALTAPGNATPASEFNPAYPPQKPGFTYGNLPGATTAFAYFETASPGTGNNGTSFEGFVADTKFTVGRGYYSEAFDESITCSTPGATIVYTTDGSLPTLLNGTQVAAPDPSSTAVATVPITRTGPVRAAAFKENLRPTNTDTNTYIFPADVASQSASVTRSVYGLPPRWGNTTPDYGMDSDVVGPRDRFGGVYAASIEENLQAVPSVSLVLPVDDMFGSRGIYSNPGNEGIRWERATSAELIRPDGTDGFQIDCGIRIQGKASRSNGLSKKNSFRLAFRAQYGTGKLKHDLYGDGATDEFDTLILRMHFNDGWSWGGAGGTPQFLREEYGHRMQRASGHPSSHGQLVHLYLNGVYWGLYNLRERPDSRFAASYFGVAEEDWDGLNTGVPVNATDDRSRIPRATRAWDTLVRRSQQVTSAASASSRHAAYMDVLGANPDGSDNPASERFLDVDNYIDYLLVNFYMSNGDWPGRNFYCGRENTPDSEGFRFFVWDPEISMHCSQGASDVRRTGVREDRINAERNAANSRRDVVTVPFQRLRPSEAFRLKFADRAHRMLANGGILYVEAGSGAWDPENPDRNRPAAVYSKLADQTESPLVAESARWGDQHRSLPYSVNTEWTRERDIMLGQWLPQRSAIFLTHLKRADLYPDTDAPAFNQHGGSVPPDFRLTMTAPAATVHYTTDGSDPLVINPDGTFSPSPTASTYNAPGIDLTSSATVSARALEGTEWSALNTAEFVVGDTPSPSTLVISEFSYRPSLPTTDEIAAGFNDRDDFEFIELMNTSDTPLDLTDVVFDDGVTFDLSSIPDPLDRTLAPGERVLVVENIDAFRFRYGPGARVLGQYRGALSNDGERLSMNLVSGSDLHTFTYNDQLPWPTCADGDGFSLTLIEPENAPVHNEPGHWACSQAIGGSPGTGDQKIAPDTYQPGHILIDNVPYATLSYSQAEGESYQPQFSTDLKTWQSQASAAITLHAETPNPDGTSTLTWRSTSPITTSEAFWRFFR